MTLRVASRVHPVDACTRANEETDDTRLKYPENRLPYVDELKVAMATEGGSILAALRTGKLDYRQWASSLDSIDGVPHRLRYTSPTARSS